jgi:hypothetical protein
MITWRPIAELPDELKDGRTLLVWGPPGFHTEAAWSPTRYGNGGDLIEPGFIWDGGALMSEVTHFSEINAPEGMG